MSEQLRVLDIGHVAAGTISAPLEMEFKDGKRVVSEAVIAHLGGLEVVSTNAHKFKDTTYKEFLEGFWKLVAKDTLNKQFQSFIGSHFNR